MTMPRMLKRKKKRKRTESMSEGVDSVDIFNKSPFNTRWGKGELWNGGLKVMGIKGVKRFCRHDSDLIPYL